MAAALRLTLPSGLGSDRAVRRSTTNPDELAGLRSYLQQGKSPDLPDQKRPGCVRRPWHAWRRGDLLHIPVRLSLFAVPSWYRDGMSKQIAVRLSDELVAFVDELVDSGAERSRAAVVSRALTRERRRAVATRDAEILSRTGPDPELQGLAEHAVELHSDLA